MVEAAGAWCCRGAGAAVWRHCGAVGGEGHGGGRSRGVRRGAGGRGLSGACPDVGGDRFMVAFSRCHFCGLIPPRCMILYTTIALMRPRGLKPPHCMILYITNALMRSRGLKPPHWMIPYTTIALMRSRGLNPPHCMILYTTIALMRSRGLKPLRCMILYTTIALVRSQRR